jgi:hypothetical protein
VVGSAPPSNTATIPSSGSGGGNITLTSSGSTTITGAASTAVPASPAPPADATFPAGLLGFTVRGVAPGGTADVTVQLPAGSNPTGYLKLRGNPAAWVDFSSHATIVGDTVTLHLTDGDGFDTDPAPGVIGDPGAPVRGVKSSGFQAPVDNLPKVNAAKAGQTIPVKWTLNKADGTPVSSPIGISLSSKGGPCASGTTDTIEAYTAGSSVLEYQGDGKWQYNWKTDKAWTGQCRTLTVTFGDGTTRTASFQFK